MDALLLEMDMWVSYTDDSDGPDFRYRLTRYTEIRNAMATVENTVKEHYYAKKHLEAQWDAFNFQAYTDASWNLMVAKKTLEELTQRTLDEISSWKGCLYH